MSAIVGRFYRLSSFGCGQFICLFKVIFTSTLSCWQENNATLLDFWTVCRNSLKKQRICQMLDFSRSQTKGWTEIYSSEPGRSSYFHWLDSPCQLVTPRIKNIIVLFRELTLIFLLFKWVHLVWNKICVFTDWINKSCFRKFKLRFFFFSVWWCWKDQPGWNLGRILDWFRNRRLLRWVWKPSIPM